MGTSKNRKNIQIKNLKANKKEMALVKNEWVYLARLKN
jgi:hypothetical protein